MKILIAGGAGFIGSTVADLYLEHGHEVMVLDNFSTGHEYNLQDHPLLHVKRLDICDREGVKELFHEFKPDIVNHHAAQVSVVVSSEDPYQDASLNIMGTLSLLEAIREEVPQAKIIYATSGGAMYGATGEVPHDESSLPIPTSPYGLSKHTAERYVWMYRDLYQVRATVLRYSNVYGPRQDSHGEAGVASIFTERMLRNQPVTIYGDGSAKRDYAFVQDVAAANLLSLDKGEGEAFNISTGVATTTQEVFNIVKKYTGYELQAESAPLRPGEVLASVLSPEKAVHGLGWTPQVSFEDGIQKTVNWYRSSGRA